MNAPPDDPYAFAVLHLTRASERMASLVERAGPCKLPHSPRRTAEERFAGLVSAIVSQQLSPKAARTIENRVRALVGGEDGVMSPERVLSLGEDALRGAGLSSAKARYLRDLAERALRGELALATLHELDDLSVIEVLSKVKGVGRWTAEMVLIFQLQRLDVLPVADLGVQKGMVRLFGLRKMPSPSRMEALAAPCRPFRSVMCWYLWRLNEDPSLLETPP